MTQRNRKNAEPVETGDDEFTVDMTTAKTFGVLPERTPLLAAISAWKFGKTANGRKLDYEFTVVAPEELKNRKIKESVSLENEYTVGRYQTMLLGLGFTKEEVTSKTFKAPKEEDVIGMQATITCRTRASETYGDRSNINTFRPASAYAVLSQVK